MSANRSPASQNLIVSLANLSGRKKGLGLFQEEMNNALITRFLENVSHGYLYLAQRMILSRPLLLLARGTVCDGSGRKIEDATALQIAFGSKNIGMCEMITRHPYLLSNVNPRTLALEQISEKFTAESVNVETQVDFQPIVDAINNERFILGVVEEETLETLANFRRSCGSRVIHDGMHFDEQILIKATKIYREHYAKWSYDQCSFFWGEVIGYLQRMLPNCLGMALRQGVHGLSKKHSQLVRDIRLEHPRFYLEKDTDIYHAHIRTACFSWNYGKLETFSDCSKDPLLKDVIAMDDFEKYCKSNNKLLSAFMRSLQADFAYRYARK